MVLFITHSYINVLHTTGCKKERRSDETPVAVFSVKYQIYPSPKIRPDRSGIVTGVHMEGSIFLCIIRSRH